VLNLLHLALKSGGLVVAGLDYIDSWSEGERGFGEGEAWENGEGEFGEAGSAIIL